MTVTHFSRYAIFDITNWNQRWDSVGVGCTPGEDPPLPADVAIVLDSSGSMASNDPSGLRRTAASQFVDALNADDRASVTDFDDTARVLQGLTSDKAALNAAIALIDDIGGTAIDAGVSAGLGTLPAATPERVNALILLTDGQGSWDPSLIARAQELRSPIFTIGLGTGPDEALLQSIATQTQGQYFGVATADQLPQVFRSIAGCVNDPTPGGGVADPDCASADTDGDGLKDCIETGGFALGSSTIVHTDPAKEDTDGDGIGDGQEAGEPSVVVEGTAAYQAISDPTLLDSDGDLLEDGEELDEGTSAWQSDSDADGLSDSDELDHGTTPLASDTDGDSLADGYEVDHAVDRGLSPTVFDEQLGTWEYIGYFVQGFLCGDITWEWIGCGENDQVVRLIGYVIGSFIPFIDIRDVLAGLIKTDWVGAAFSLAGLIPAVGDAASVVAKIGKFLSKFPAKLAPVMRWVANSDVLGDTVKTTVFRVLLPGFSTLENAGFTPQTLARIMQHQKIDDLVAALGSGLRVTGTRAVPMPWAVRNGRVPASRVAEEAVQNLVVRGQLDNAWTAVRGTTTNAVTPRAGLEPAVARGRHPLGRAAAQRDRGQGRARHAAQPPLRPVRPGPQGPRAPRLRSARREGLALRACAGASSRTVPSSGASDLTLLRSRAWSCTASRSSSTRRS